LIPIVRHGRIEAKPYNFYLISPMTISNSFYQLVDGGQAAISVYVKPENITIGDGETKDIPIQDNVLTVVQLVKRTIEATADGLNEAIASAIMARKDQTTLDLIAGTYGAGFTIDFGAFSLVNLRLTAVKPIVPETVNGNRIYTTGFGFTYSSASFS